MGKDGTPQIPGRDADRSGYVVQTPSAHAGVAHALRTTYRAYGVPAEMAQLLAKLK